MPADKTFFVGYDTPTILAFDEATTAQVAQIKTAGPDVVALTLSPDDSTLFAATGNFAASCTTANSTLSTIDTATLTIRTTVTISGEITDLAASRNGANLVATVNLPNGTAMLDVFNPATLSLIKTIALPAQAFREGVVVTSDGNTAFVTISTQSVNLIVRANIAAGTATTLIHFPLGSGEWGIALDANDQHIYAARLKDGVKIYSASSGAQTGAIGLGPNSQWYSSLVGSPDKSVVLIGGIDNLGHNQGTIINTATATTIHQFSASSDSTNAGAVNGTDTEGLFYPSYIGSTPTDAYALPSGSLIGAGTTSETFVFVISLAAE